MKSLFHVVFSYTRVSSPIYTRFLLIASLPSSFLTLSMSHSHSLFDGFRSMIPLSSVSIKYFCSCFLSVKSRYSNHLIFRLKHNEALFIRFASAILVHSTPMIQRLWKLCMKNEKQFNPRNPAWEKLFGYSRAECEGKHVIELMVGPADATIATEIMNLVLEVESHTLQSDLAIVVKSKVKNHDYKQNQPGIYSILSPTAEWMVTHGISWPGKGNGRTAAGYDARSCFHWLYRSDLELTYIQQMGSSMPAKIERQPQVNTTTLIPSFDKLYEIKWEDLMIRECIGKGSYGTLYHAVWYGSDVAANIIPRKGYSRDLTFSFMQEVSFMKRFWHPNILLFMGVVVSPQHLRIVSEFLARGSLFQLLHRSRGKFKLKRHVHMALDIARGMNYLHSCYPPIIHCDLKSSNLYVDKHWTVKIGDFGLCRTKHEAKQGIGTPAWMAPEVLYDEEASKSDVYSYGVVLWEITTEKVPWDGLSSTQVAKAVGFITQLDIQKDVDSRWASIIERCLCSEPDSRPTFQEIRDDLNELQKNVSD